MLRYPEASGHHFKQARCFGVPQHDIRIPRRWRIVARYRPVFSRRASARGENRMMTMIHQGMLIALILICISPMYAATAPEQPRTEAVALSGESEPPKTPL